MAEITYNNPLKIYVAVTAKFSPEGAITPVSFVFEDGVTYEIDRIVRVDRCASLKAGGVGWRYTFEIMGHRRQIWREEDRWFLERKN